MSSSSEYSAYRTAKCPPEKSTFSQTCSLLSQYLKEKGTFGDLTLGMTCDVETNGGSPETSCHSATTMELFPTVTTLGNHVAAMDFLSTNTAYPHHSEAPTTVKSSAVKSVEKEPKAAQLTIFYRGQVIVFDDFPAEKMEEIMSLASKGGSLRQNSSAYKYTRNQQGNHTSSIPSVSPQASSTPIARDLPIARKISLHRFLEKRKDRIAAKAPYQVKNPNSAPSKRVESMPWLGLGARTTQI